MTKTPRMFLAGLALPATMGWMAFTLVSPAHAHNKESGGPDAMFKMMDANDDGKISPEEHAEAARKMFEKMDANSDGKVTAAEMDTFHTHMAGKTATRRTHEGAKGHEMSSADKIKVIDSDHDGTLTADEHAAGSKSMFAKMDTDKDGFLTKTELDAGHEKLMHGLQAPAK